MLPDTTSQVLLLYFVQGLTALVIALILRKIYLDHQNNYFRYWHWSWLAMFAYMIGSGVALFNAFTLEYAHPFRIITSTLNITFGLVQFFWIYAGAFELALKRSFNRSRFRIFTALVIPISIGLVFLYFDDPSMGDYRIFFRLGIKSFFGACAYTVSAILILRIVHSGIGMKLIFVSFLLYAVEELNYFVGNLSTIFNYDYPFAFPFYIGIFNLFIQSMMGLGMILSILELDQRRLKKANEELDTFLYRSYHDLRGPLTTIAGVVNAMKITEDKKQHDEFLNAIEDRVQQADNVIRDIILLRTNQKSDVAAERVDLLYSIQDEVDTLCAQNENNPQININTTENTEIFTDPQRIRTILSNLLTNAFKYHIDLTKAVIDISIERSINGVLIKITDNGIGIDERHLTRIFDMFYRATMTAEGTGLGLYLVKDALNDLGGSIDVKSSKDVGTTFEVYLPSLN